MDPLQPEDVRRALASFDTRQQKIVAGLFADMIHEPSRVKDREWVSERLTNVTVLAGEFEADNPQAGVDAVRTYLQAHAPELLRASLMLFQRVGLDFAPRAKEGFTYEEALRAGLEYLPSIGSGATSGEATNRGREMGEQPLARLMRARALEPKHLVAASTEQLTHKMVTRAMKGRRLTANTMNKVHRAWNAATSLEDPRSALFDYEP